jgi:hypothetical protein
MRNHFLILFLFILSGCGKKSDTRQILEKSLLLFPAENSVCLTGTSVSDQKTLVDFSWTKANNAVSYELTIKNLSTNNFLIKATSINNLKVELSKSSPYSWYVTCKSDKIVETAQSTTWKFYTSGQGSLNYSPFPADKVFPDMNQIIDKPTLDLEWKGSSIDKNIIGYDIFFSKDPNPLLLRANVKEEKIIGVSVLPKSQYYWKIITKDANGNSSESNIFKFSTQ